MESTECGLWQSRKVKKFKGRRAVVEKKREIVDLNRGHGNRGEGEGREKTERKRRRNKEREGGERVTKKGFRGKKRDIKKKSFFYDQKIKILFINSFFPY